MKQIYVKNISGTPIYDKNVSNDGRLIYAKCYSYGANFIVYVVFMQFDLNMNIVITNSSYITVHLISTLL